MIAMIVAILAMTASLLIGCGEGSGNATVSVTRVNIEDTFHGLNSGFQPSFDGAKNLWTATKPVNGSRELHIYGIPGPGYPAPIRDWDFRFFVSGQTQSLTPADYTQEVLLEPGALTGSVIFSQLGRYLVVSYQKGVPTGIFTFLDVTTEK